MSAFFESTGSVLLCTVQMGHRPCGRQSERNSSHTLLTQKIYLQVNYFKKASLYWTAVYSMKSVRIPSFLLFQDFNLLSLSGGVDVIRFKALPCNCHEVYIPWFLFVSRNKLSTWINPLSLPSPEHPMWWENCWETTTINDGVTFSSAPSAG